MNPISLPEELSEELPEDPDELSSELSELEELSVTEELLEEEI